jgi:hypothetical protein
VSPPEKSVVEIVEVIRRSEQGITLPFICRGDDDNTYFVKGVGAGRDSQIKEWIAGNLALSFGIPVAPFSIVYVPEELSELLSIEHARDLGTGPAFGSVEQMVTELSYSQISSICPEVRRAVLFFDWWIFNADRMLTESGGNPNLFWGPNTQRLVVIDHNQAFDSEFSNEDFFKLHIFKDCAPSIFDDLLERDHYTLRAEQALYNWQPIVSRIPEEWLYSDQEMTMKTNLNLDLLLENLQRFNNSDFWSRK